MPFIPVPNSALLRIFYISNGNFFTNNIYFGKDSPWSVAELTNLTAYANTWFNATWKPTAGGGCSVAEFQASGQDSDSDPVVSLSPGAVITGTVTGDMLPSNAAVVATLRTVFRGRSFRGRVYHGGLTEAMTAGNTVSVGYVNAIDTHWSYPLTTPPPSSSQLVVASRYTGKNPRNPGIFTPVTSVTVNSRVDTQRRRIPYA